MKNIRKYLPEMALIALVLSVGIAQSASAGTKLIAEFSFEDFIEATALIARSPLGIEERVKTEITAYTSDPRETDSTPCHTATNFNLCAHNEEDVAAANHLPLGTRFMIPSLFGDRIFTVRDRMNVRYHDRIDLWFRDRERAKQFGLRHAEIVILGSQGLAFQR
jgi:3D (Asp-Asp-Asp) domain-containing protein